MVAAPSAALKKEEVAAVPAAAEEAKTEDNALEARLANLKR
jgi:hypothetical protein